MALLQKRPIIVRSLLIEATPYLFKYLTLYIYIYIYTNILMNIYLPNGLQGAAVCSYSVILVYICIYVQCKGEGVEGEDHTI